MIGARDARQVRRRRERGVTLVELIAFIVIVAVIATAMVQAFSSTMRGSHYGKELTQATQLAQQRMEIIIGRRKGMGYAAFLASGANYDPCQSGLWAGQELCATTSSYTVSSTAPVADACGTGCAEITVSVTSPTDGTLLTQLTYQVWDY